MRTVLKILLWIAAIIVGLVLHLLLLALLGGAGAETIPFIILFAGAMTSIVFALCYVSFRKPEKASSPQKESLSQASPGSVSYQALRFEDALQVKDYVVVDVETTGLNPETHEIIEVAAIRCIGGRFEVYKSFVFPRNRIPEHITQLTGIRNIDVMNAPQINQVAPKLFNFFQGLPVVAHNAPFDVKFIAAAFQKIGAKISMQYIDTVQLSRIAFPGMPNYKLETLIGALNLIPGKQQHRAESDAIVTQRLFELCRREIPRRAAEEQRLREQKRLDEQRLREQKRLDEQRLREQEKLEEKGYNLNQYGMQAEAAGDIEKALRYYEDVLSEKISLPHAYMRLAVIYKKQHRWNDVVRVCDAALTVLPGNQGKLAQPEEWEKRKAYALSKMENSDAPKE